MSPLILDDIVKDILTTRVYDVAIESPLERAEKLSNTLGCNVYLKREDLQPVHSFKLRGAYNKMSQLTDDEKQRGVIAASAGNHAQGVALAAKRLGMSALIIMPRTTPGIKIDAVKSYSAEIELYGDNYSEAAEYSLQRTKETGRTFIHPFDDPLVIAGQGTIGREIIEQLPDTTHIFVSVGGGGMIAGIASYVKAIRPDIKIISVEPVDSNCLQAAVIAGKRVTLQHVGIFADGVAVKQIGKATFEIANRLVDDFVTVTTDQICSAIKSTFEDTRSIVEPAGALALAGLQHYNLPAGSHAVAICSGANMTFERLQQIAERTLLGSGHEGLFSITMPEKPGALQAFCQNVVGGRSITEFSYRLNQRSTAHVLIGITVSDQDDRLNLLRTINEQGYDATDLTDDDIAKEHVRHMVGGPASDAKNEVFYQIEFPERPGALGDFLATLASRWNISLFHYRTAAGDTGNVLIGFEAADKKSLDNALSQTNFTYRRMNSPSSVYFSKSGNKK